MSLTVRQKPRILEKFIHIIFRRRKGRDLPYLGELPLLRITEGNWVGVMGEISVMDCDSMCEILSDCIIRIRIIFECMVD